MGDTTRFGSPGRKKGEANVSSTVRVIVFNADEESGSELRAHLLGIEGVKIVAEVEEPAFLGQVIDQFPAEVVLIHLDPNPQGLMDVIAPVLERKTDGPSAIAMTEDRDAELVMRAMRVGMKEFLWKPFPPEQLNDILVRVGQASAATGNKQLGKLIPVVGMCGGVGATTIATNLAVEIAHLVDPNPNTKQRPKVAVVDLDFRFGQVALFMDAQPTYTIAELCESPEELDAQMIDRAMVRHGSGVHVLAHPADFSAAERISAGQVAGVLSILQEYYHYIVVDGPVRFDPTARAVFDMTDIYLLVLSLLVPAVRNTDRVLSSMQMNGYSMERVRLVCNRFGRDNGFLEPSDVEATLARKLDWMLPDDWKVCSAAVNMGACLSEHAPKSKIRTAYQQMAADLTGMSLDGEVAPVDGKGKGIFSFLAGNRS
jgi:pilus assembly protein CpaE